jgi:hypothetical protein
LFEMALNCPFVDSENASNQRIGNTRVSIDAQYSAGLETLRPQISRLSKLVVIAERFENGIFEGASDGLPVDFVSRGKGGSGGGHWWND